MMPNTKGSRRFAPGGSGGRGGAYALSHGHSTTESPACQLAALSYAARGWPVFPCRPRGKTPLTPHGFKDATCDPETIRAWWERWPDANIAIPTGAPSGLLALDVDPRSGGDESLRELEQRYGPLPRTVESLTGGGGRHILFRCPNSMRCGKLAEGIDIKANGGYIIVPPSVHPNGRPYVWLHPDDVPPAEPPAWLLELARPQLLRAAAALRRLKPERCDNYDDWLRVGMALTELGDPGLALWDAWSRGSPKYEPGVCAGKWRTLTPGAGITLASLYHWAREDAKEEAPAGTSSLPVIEVTPGRLPLLATEGENALIRAGSPVYARGDLLQRPVIDEVDAADGRKTRIARLATLTPEALVDYLARSARWQRYNERAKGFVPTDPPLMVAKIILSRAGEWCLPRVAGVITTPTLRPDGTIFSEPGLDPATRLLLVSPPPLPPIPERPTRADAEAGLELLADLLAEFPFADEESRSVALSALITPVVRAALGAVPLHAATSPSAGTGKSYLFDLAAAIATGRWCPVIAAGDCDRAELEKRLGAAALAATPLLSLDNVNGVLKSDLLCLLIERPLVDVRVLGLSRNVTVETRMTLFATGNNLALAGDLVRRCIRCRLDAQVERPELRRFIRDPYRTITADRGRYIAAALTIVRAYIVAGKPDQRPRLASFEAWSDLVRSALVWLGCADPVETMEAIREDDPERAELRAVVEAWAEAIGTGEPVTVADLIARAESKMQLNEALMAVAGVRGGIDARRLGYWLRRQRGRMIGAWCIEAVGTTHGIARWKLRRTR
ncbi:MAG: bifunctional DNA primase/polymerase [Chloroflexia bacterium]